MNWWKWHYDWNEQKAVWHTLDRVLYSPIGCLVWAFRLLMLMAVLGLALKALGVMP